VPNYEIEGRTTI